MTQLHRIANIAGFFFQGRKITHRHRQRNDQTLRDMPFSQSDHQFPDRRFLHDHRANDQTRKDLSSVGNDDRKAAGYNFWRVWKHIVL